MSRGDLFPSFYFRDWKNAERFKPNFTPPRLNFNGFVEFNFNPSVVATIAGDGLSFRNQITSLVQTADLPTVNFKTEVKNQYNMKRIVTYGVDYDPVNIDVFDTINNEWLIVFMRYFSYMHMNPRNKSGPSTQQFNLLRAKMLELRDTTPQSYPSNAETLTRNSGFMKDSFDSNAAGLNLNLDYNFFDSIKIVNYAGQQGVEYILFKPTITSFKMGNIDYKSSDARTFSMTLDYENFTINDTVNFDLSSDDLTRWENVLHINMDAITNPLFKQTMFGYKTKHLGGMMGTKSNPVGRASQPVGKIIP